MELSSLFSQPPVVRFNEGDEDILHAGQDLFKTEIRDLQAHKFLPNPAIHLICIPGDHMDACTEKRCIPDAGKSGDPGQDLLGGYGSVNPGSLPSWTGFSAPWGFPWRSSAPGR